MNRTTTARWLLGSVIAVFAIGSTVLSVVGRPPLEPADADRTFILDLTQGTRPYCPVHSTKMGVAKVPVEYGLPVAEVNRTQRFPHSRAIAQGGCAPSPATNAWVYLCPDCQRAEDAWKLAQTPAP